jgi:chromosome segregation ATPase
LNDLEGQFAEIENRVRALVAEDRALRMRINELEQELALVRRETRNVEHVHGKHLHVREKIERVLQSLETLGTKE